MTVSVADLPPYVAVTVKVPLLEVKSTGRPANVLNVATEAFDVVHAACVVTSETEPLASAARATN